MENLHSDTSVVGGQSDHRKGVAAVSLKGSVFTLPIVKIQQADLSAIEKDLTVHLASAPGFFRDSPVVLDLGAVPDWQVEFNQLRTRLAGLDLVVVAVQNASEQQSVQARSAGLGLMPASPKVVAKQERQQVAEQSRQDSEDRADQANQGAGRSPLANDGMQAVEPELEEKTLVMHQPIRSGQRLYARGGDLIQLAAVNPGAEIMADGNIHIYAPLRGRALAGVSGNERARIFCHSMEAELIAVAGNYRVFEDNVPTEWYKKSVQIYLQNEQLIIRSIG